MYGWLGPCLWFSLLSPKKSEGGTDSLLIMVTTWVWCSQDTSWEIVSDQSLLFFYIHNKHTLYPTYTDTAEMNDLPLVTPYLNFVFHSFHLKFNLFGTYVGLCLVCLLCVNYKRYTIYFLHSQKVEGHPRDRLNKNSWKSMRDKISWLLVPSQIETHWILHFSSGNSRGLSLDLHRGITTHVWTAKVK